MTTSTYVYSTTIVVVTCGVCGIPHGLPTDVKAARLSDGGAWYCPNGHRISYAETEEQKLRRRLKISEDVRARLVAERDQIEASRRAWKGQATRARRAVLAGTCPFCGQHLRDLERHVARQHASDTAEGEA